MKLTKTQSLIYKVIQQNPGVENDEMKLIEAVWNFQGWDDTKSLYWNLTRVIHPESISRRRRELYNMGLITYSNKALRERTIAFKKEVNIHSYYEQDMAEIVKPKQYIEVIDGEMVMVVG